jgi:hypothetical protein
VANSTGVVCDIPWAGSTASDSAVRAQEVQVAIAQPPIPFLTADTGGAQKKLMAVPSN